MDKTDFRDDIYIKTPNIHSTAFIADGAKVIGDVILKKNSSIWYNTVVRADINSIVIGERSNIQDNSVIHLENDQGVIVGNDVTVGHNVILHGCKVGDGVLIGMGAVIMNGVDIGKGSGYLNNIGKKIKALSIEKGLFIRPLGNVIYLLPPLCITDHQIKKSYSIILEVLSDL